MVVCMILLAQLPDKVMRILPQVLLAPTVQRDEGLLLPKDPWVAKRERWERGDLTTAGATTAAPCLQRVLLDCILQISRAATSVLKLGNFYFYPS